MLADEEYERIQKKKWEHNGDVTPAVSHPDEDIEDRLARHAREEDDAEHAAEAIEMQDIEERKKFHHRALGGLTTTVNTLNPINAIPTSWAHRSPANPTTNNQNNSNQSLHRAPKADSAEFTEFARRRLERLEKLRLPAQLGVLEDDAGVELESQGKQAAVVGDALFGAFNDEIEDLTPEERDTLVQRAFLHKALRARRPVIWIPRDDLGVSRDEIRRTEAFSPHLSISDEWTGLDAKVRVVIKRAPPDFSELDLIEL